MLQRYSLPLFALVIAAILIPAWVAGSVRTGGAPPIRSGDHGTPAKSDRRIDAFRDDNIQRIRQLELQLQEDATAAGGQRGAAIIAPGTR